MSRRLALLLGNTAYQDPTLAQLVTPQADANTLAEVLRFPAVGGFDSVAALVNASSTEIRLEIESFFADKRPDDLLVLYFSGHGVRDDQGELYLAARDTLHHRLRATAIPAGFITEEMDRSRSKRQVLILDCCHSGAFAQGSKGALGASVGTASAFEGTGYGRVVLTATDSTQYAWEGDHVIGQAENSVFTHFLIDGLRSGAADTDGDGQITLDELYNYVYEQVVTHSPRQTPGKWSYRQQGEIVIARNPRPAPKPAPLPHELLETLADPRPWVRDGGVRALAEIVRTGPAGQALSAAEALRTLAANDDSLRVRQAAAAALGAEPAPRPVEAPPPVEAPRPVVARPPVEAPPPETAPLAEAASQPAAVAAERRAPAPAAPLQSDNPPAPAAPFPPLSEVARTYWRPIALQAFGWAVAMAALAWINWQLYNSGADASAYWLGAAAGGLIGGGAVWLALRGRVTADARTAAWIGGSWVAAVWAAVWVSQALQSEWGIDEANAAGAAVGGALGGLAMAVGLARFKWVPRGEPPVWIFAGWAGGWLLAAFLGLNVVNAFGDDAGAGAKHLILQWLPLDTETARALGEALVTLCFGAAYSLAGAVGGGLMLWQIDRARTPSEHNTQ